LSLPVIHIYIAINPPIRNINIYIYYTTRVQKSTEKKQKFDKKISLKGL